MVEFDGAELLSELRPTEGVTEGQPEVPMEWTSPIWPHVAALAERIRVIKLLYSHYRWISMANIPCIVPPSNLPS